MEQLIDQVTHIGVDPGKSGSIALLSGPGELVIESIKLNETERDISDWLAERCHTSMHAYIEKVHSSPQMGVKSSFTFGQSYGFLRGLLIGFNIPFETVSPAKWQRAMGCLSKGDKNVTKRKAQELFPGVKITHANADAILLAEHCRRTREYVGSEAN